MVCLNKSNGLPLHSKILKSNQTTMNKGLKKLQCASLSDALAAMEVGETCIAPDGYSPKTVIKTCVEMKVKGYIYQTTQRTGQQLITRIQ